MNTAPLILLLSIGAVFVVADWLIRRSQARQAALTLMYSSLRPGEDPRIVTVALFYRESLDEIRARLEAGQYISYALGHTLLFLPIPPIPPQPPARHT